MPPGRILIVGADDTLRRLVVAMLVADGYTVRDAQSAPDALRILDEPAEPGFDLLITDVDMPGTSGFALGIAVHRQSPDMPILFITGRSDDADAAGIPERLTGGFLPRPFRPADLRRAVRAALA